MRSRSAPAATVWLRCPLLPSPEAIGVSHLRVYDSVAPDGLRGGAPHVHAGCTEAYLVIAGRGAVQTLGPAGFRELPLEPGAFVWLTPGTIHRLVNGDGALEIVVLMQNAGLPEAGDMVITFAPETLADFHAQVARLVAPRAKGWRDLVEQGPIAAARATEAQLESLTRGIAPHLADASVHRLPPPPAERRMGCCGTLGVYLRETIEPDCAKQAAR